MAWNAFKFCTGLKILGSIMVLVVLAIVAVTYYAVVIASYGPELSKGGSTAFLAFLVLAVFHGLLGMLLWSYFAVVLTDPGGVPPDWHPFSRGEDDLEAQSLQALDAHRQAALGNYPPSAAAAAAASAASVASADVLSESAPGDYDVDHDDDSSAMDDPRAALVGPTGGRTGMEGGGKQQQEQQQAVSRGGGGGMVAGRDGRGDVGMASGAVEIRRCKRCLQFKPPRAHHCSVCGRCILKMDHHCVWVINCVGAKNYKQFLLFLFYTFVETALVALALLPHFIDFFTSPPTEKDDATRLATVFLSFVLNIAFAISLLGFLIMHVSLVLGNTTTIEAFEKRGSHRWRFDLGRKRNFEQVFGMDRRYWLLPMYSPEDLRRMPVLQGLDYPHNPEYLQEFEVSRR
ncbi:hypothetical protein CLOM_g10274 [Closterium sp. NIES-68]|nr:hypothetical protein CLOM_g3377 [Closterium sp. NIES-68]GJP51106.1 hypothetical protein CLOM_g10274 [Closterium sp. NIES-68]GJP78162.1 hypothetical protein CLOP_g8494 [Closterium sp. NIES-67]